MAQVGYGTNVFVTTAREVDQNALVGTHGFGQLHAIGNRVAGFQLSLIHI